MAREDTAYSRPRPKREPAELTGLELLQDLAGYVFGSKHLGYHPAEWDAMVVAWTASPRGQEMLDRLSHANDLGRG